MRKRYLALLALAFFATSSCSINEPVVSTDHIKDTSLENREVLKMNFGKALARSLAESPLLRALIKTEALKMFNNDFDVLYHLIKDSKLEEGITMRELLLKTMHNQELTIIENEIPLLTIFVPELPENSFSATSWNVLDQIPVVAISSSLTNDVRMIKPDLQEYTLAANLIPSFPVVVVKENERVVVGKDIVNAHALGRTFNAKVGNSRNFTFLADCFDGSLTNPQNSSRTTSVIDQKIKNAYQIYKNADGWQRDYIYYGITPTQPNGPFSYDFQEHIVSFGLLGDPSNAYSKIADQSSDPKLKVVLGGSTPGQNAGWTGGFYEFKVRLLFNSKNGLGEEFITYFSATPAELFKLKYEKISYWWFPEIISLKSKDINLPLFNWDLNSYASSIKIEIEEVDLTVTTTTTETRQVKFATNFAIEEEFLKKIGLKFGASLEDNQTQTTTKTFTEGNDALGSVIINFADNIVVSAAPSSSPTSWSTREYQSGWFTISVEPKRVQ